LAETELSPQQAAATIQSMRGWDQALRQRTDGLMWMTWAFIAAGTFVTYALVASVLDTMPPWMGLVWMPWALPGILVTYLLWRSVGILLPGGPPMRRVFAGYVAGFLVVTIGGVAVAMILHLPLLPPTIVLFGLGTATTALGVARLRSQPTAFIPVLIGLTMGAIAVWEAFSLNGETFMDGVHTAALLNAPIVGVGFLLVGLARYVRN
jgi:hypothetical protein